MICRELRNQRYEGTNADINLYGQTHYNTRQLISGWFRRAQEMKGCQGMECFDAFFFLWLAFNGWAVCITDCDYDAAYIDALKRNQQLCRKFSELTVDDTSPLAREVAQFANLWPVFNVRELRRQNLLWRHAVTREEAINYYLRQGVNSFAPRCWQRHEQQADQLLHRDWPHTLSALYQIRCNFFHGGKRLDLEEDQRIVSAAYMTLLTFLEQGNYVV